MRLIEKLLFIPAMILEGIRLWVEPPRRIRFIVDHDWEERRARERAEMDKKYGRIRDIEIPPDKGHRLPPLKCIHMYYWIRTGFRRKKYRADTRIAVNLENRRIDRTYTDSWLLNEHHKGSGMIGVALFSAPFMIPISPFLKLASWMYGRAEKRRGISRHGYAVFKAIHKQLDAETRDMLLEALKEDWRHKQEMRRQVSMEEAKHILSKCELFEETVTEERAQQRYGGTLRGFHWFKDDYQVAHGNFHGSRGEHYVRVLGTTFKDAEADQLVDIHRTKKIHVFGQKDDH